MHLHLQLTQPTLQQQQHEQRQGKPKKLWACVYRTVNLARIWLTIMLSKVWSLCSTNTHNTINNIIISSHKWGHNIQTTATVVRPLDTHLLSLRSQSWPYSPVTPGRPLRPCHLCRRRRRRRRRRRPARHSSEKYNLRTMVAIGSGKIKKMRGIYRMKWRTR